MKKIYFLSVMCLIVLTMQAQKRCVVLDFQVGNNVTEEETDAISYCFRSNFHPTGYQKLEQVLVTRTISDFGYSRTEMTQQQIIKIGRELEANIIVVGVLNKFMEEYSMDIRVINVAKGNTTVSESANFLKSSYLDTMEKTAKRLVSKLRGASSDSSGVETTPGYTDLGLPSGTIWKNFNATGFYTYNEAVSQFGKRLPSRKQWEELKSECQWTWEGSSYKVTGPNGNSILLPAAGYSNTNGVLESVGSTGFYWSSTPENSEKAWELILESSNVRMNITYRGYMESVRLVQE